MYFVRSTKYLLLYLLFVIQRTIFTTKYFFYFDIYGVSIFSVKTVERNVYISPVRI